MRTVNVYAASINGKFGTTRENFGDNLMHFLLPELFNVNVNYVRHSRADLLGIGSILDSYWRRRGGSRSRVWRRRPWRKLAVWGSGFMSSESADYWPQRLEYHAVRGPLTAARIAGGAEVALGDPAILLPLVWSAPAVKKHPVLVVPHFASHNAFAEMYGNLLPKHWKMLDLRNDPKTVCESIAASEFVITSSLHGLIVADAYGVPACRIDPINEIKGDGFKYRDYGEQRGRALAPAVDFASVLEGNIDLTSPEYLPMVPTHDVVERLILSFPYR